MLLRRPVLMRTAPMMCSPSVVAHNLVLFARLKPL